MTNPTTTEIIYTYDNGKVAVRYTRAYGSDEAAEFIEEVIDNQAMCLATGTVSAYDWRNV